MTLDKHRLKELRLDMTKQLLHLIKTTLLLPTMRTDERNILDIGLKTIEQEL